MMIPCNKFQVDVVRYFDFSQIDFQLKKKNEIKDHFFETQKMLKYSSSSKIKLRNVVNRNYLKCL